MPNSPASPAIPRPAADLAKRSVVPGCWYGRRSFGAANSCAKVCNRVWLEVLLLGLLAEPISTATTPAVTPAQRPTVAAAAPAPLPPAEAPAPALAAKQPAPASPELPNLSSSEVNLPELWQQILGSLELPSTRMLLSQQAAPVDAIRPAGTATGWAWCKAAPACWSRPWPKPSAATDNWCSKPAADQWRHPLWWHHQHPNRSRHRRFNQSRPLQHQPRQPTHQPISQQRLHPPSQRFQTKCRNVNSQSPLQSQQGPSQSLRHHPRLLLISTAMPKPWPTSSTERFWPLTTLSLRKTQSLLSKNKNRTQEWPTRYK